MNSQLDQAKCALDVQALRLAEGDRVLVAGGYGCRNVGDEAILAGLLAEMPEGAAVRVVSRDPRDTAALHGVASTTPLAAPWHLLHSDVLIVGGGGIFSGHMGRRGELLPLFCRLALARGLRVGLAGIGVYPSTPQRVLRQLVRIAPRLATFTVRDSASAEFLASLGVDATLAPDLSNGMPEAPSERGVSLLREMGSMPDKPVVGLFLTATDPRLAQALLETIPQVVQALPDVQFCFVPMSHHPSVLEHNDLQLAHRLRELVPGLAVHETWEHPADILSLTRHLDAAVCMRYHSLLFAGRAGIPIVPIPYAEKCDDWLDEHDVARVDLTLEALSNAIRRAVRTRKHWSEHALGR